MAAPSGILWGSIVTGNNSVAKGKIGVYVGVTENTATSYKVNVQVWFATMYSCRDGYNHFYYDIGTNVTAATTEIGEVEISTSHDTGSGWNSANQVQLLNKTYTYTKDTSAVTYKVYAKFSGIDLLPSKVMYVNTSFKVPALESYTITYNANGGSGAPSAQTKYYGKTLTLSSTKPSRTGYSFQGWALSKADADDGDWYYAAGSSCGKNEDLTLYAVWKANTYAVTYNANGGSGAPASQTKTYGVALTLSSTKPTRTNYNFLGWGTSASATTVAYKAGASYTSNAKITLYAVWQLAYKKPRITDLSVARCNADGTLIDDGMYALVTFGWECDQALTSIQIDCIPGSGDTISTTITSSDTSGTVNTVVGEGNLSTEATYTIHVVVTDTGGYYDRSKTLPGLTFLIDALHGGTGIAFGKPAELPDYADFRWNILFDNYQGVYGRDLAGNIKLALQAQNENGNTILGWSNYDLKSGNTNVYGYDVNIGVSNIASPTYFRPYFRQGDTLNVTIRTAGYVTNGGKDVCFTVPLSVPIIGSPTVTVTSLNGFTLRQGSTYTHGSSASTFCTPATYTAYRSMYNGIGVVATFEDVTNVTNNDSIGIYWNGTITFT